MAKKGRHRRSSGPSRARASAAAPFGTVKELDPLRRCGEGTTVERLFRVDSSEGGRSEVHLVFFDRHGWYCVHGPDCAAVAEVRDSARSRKHTTRLRAGQGERGAR